MKTLQLKLVKLRRLSSLVLILIIAGACKKTINLNRDWSGFVLEKNTQVPVVGAQVIIKASMVSSGVFNSALQPIGTVTTDENGYYSFEYERNNFTEVVAEVSKQEYFYYKENLDVEAIADNKTFRQNFIITPQARISLQIRHDGNGVDEKSLTYRNLSIYRDCNDCCNNDNLIFDNNVVNYISNCISEGNVYHRYSTIELVNNQQTKIIDSIYVTKGDTAFIQITY